MIKHTVREISDPHDDACQTSGAEGLVSLLPAHFGGGTVYFTRLPCSSLHTLLATRTSFILFVEMSPQTRNLDIVSFPKLLTIPITFSQYLPSVSILDINQ